MFRYKASESCGSEAYLRGYAAATVGEDNAVDGYFPPAS